MSGSIARKMIAKTAVDAFKLCDFKFGPFTIPYNHCFFQTSFSYSFVNLKPIVPGHVLVSPKRLAIRLSDLSDVEHEDLWRTVRIVSQSIEKHYNANGVNISVQDGATAGQSVPHVHVHILPRIRGDYENNDDVYEDIESFNYDSEPVPTRAKLYVPPSEERRLRSLEEMALEAATLSQLFENQGLYSSSSSA